MYLAIGAGSIPVSFLINDEPRSTVLLFYYVLIGPSLYMIRFDYVSRWILLVVDIDLPVCTGRPIPMTSE